MKYMKKIIKISFVATSIILLIGVSLYCLIRISRYGSLFCIKENHYNYSLSTYGPPKIWMFWEFPRIKCCKGLNSISPGSEFDDNFGCLMPIGGGTICWGSCGDDVCESPENQCNCPEDCGQPKNNGSIIEGQIIDDQFINSENHKICNKNTDCKIVKSYKACTDVEAINKKISDNEWNSYWENKYKDREKEILLKCLMPELGFENSKPICENNLCKAVNKN